MEFSIEKASELTGKSVKTIYRHMSQNGLRYGVDDNGNRKISLKELQNFYSITIQNDLNDSQMRFSNENDIENKLDVLIELSKMSLELQKEQVNATNKNTAMVESQIDSQMRIDTVEGVENIRTIKAAVVESKPTKTKPSAPVDYLDIDSLSFISK